MQSFHRVIVISPPSQQLLPLTDLPPMPSDCQSVDFLLAMKIPRRPRRVKTTILSKNDLGNHSCWKKSYIPSDPSFWRSHWYSSFIYPGHLSFLRSATKKSNTLNGFSSSVGPTSRRLNSPFLVLGASHLPHHQLPWEESEEFESPLPAMYNQPAGGKDVGGLNLAPKILTWHLRRLEKWFYWRLVISWKFLLKDSNHILQVTLIPILRLMITKGLET